MTFIDLPHGNYEPGSGSDPRVEIHFGTRADTFQRYAGASGFDEVSYEITGHLEESGSPLAPVYTYTAGDGTQAIFRPMGNECGGPGYCAYVSQIIFPDGTSVDFAYDEPTSGSNDTRLRRVSSSRGYVLLLEYGSGAIQSRITKACLLNLAYHSLPVDYVCPSDAEVSASYQYSYFQPPSGFNGYAGAGYRLASYTDPLGKVWSYGYQASGTNILNAYTRPGESSPWLVNTVFAAQNAQGNAFEIVSHQAMETGETYQYYWNEKPPGDALHPPAPEYVGGRYIDADGAIVQVNYGFPPMPGSLNPTRVSGASAYPSVNYGTVTYQVTPGPETITDQLGRTVTNDYCDPNAAVNLPSFEHNRCLVTMKQSTTLPDGQQQKFEYQGWQTKNLTKTTSVSRPGAGDADIIRQASYSDCLNLVTCAKPISITDAKGGVTNYVYDQTHGGVLKKTMPADASGVRPETRYSYSQHYPWLKSSGGGYSQATSPVWLLDTEESCRTSSTDANGNCAAGASDKVVTSYQYEQGSPSKGSNLLLLGKAVTADGLTLRSCYSYDAMGRKISETAPNANLAICP
ncbi:MAG: hypothetical protein IE913_02720 [Halothiobacillus sp.]|nr:hypothetical protein [Paracoccaceae bacterium]MBD3815372.1 hypothetical protein [Halothiobacillus sp.]